MGKTKAEAISAWIDLGERLLSASEPTFDRVEKLVRDIVEGQELLVSFAAPLRPAERFRTRRYSA